MKGRYIALLGILAVILSAVGGYGWYLGKIYPEKVAEGYVAKSVLGLPYAVWEPGVPHPRNGGLVASETAGEWRCIKPGYVWAGKAEIEWKPGAPHPENANLRAGAQPDEWEALPGYTWEGGATTQWNEGVISEEYPHWVTTAEEGTWRPADGYKLENPEAPMLSPVVWDSSWSSDSKRATAEEGVFEHKQTCKNCGGDKVIRRTKTCASCGGAGKITTSTENCANCGASGKVSSASPCSGCEGKGKISSQTTCTRCDGKGRTPCRHPRSFHDSGDGMHLMMCGHCSGNKRVFFNGTFVPCPSCGGQGIFTCRQCGGRGSLKCKKCTDGQVVSSSVPCPACGGKGHAMVSCSSCGGAGVHHHYRDCSDCQDGKTTHENTCAKCKGEGHIWK